MKVDLHTHSTASPDGGIRPADYAALLRNGTLNYIAVTDHDTIDLALDLHKIHGDRIIVGQEITCQEGELVGLFLTKKITPGTTVLQAAKAIHAQGGIVYVPHPFETVRKGISPALLEAVAADVDIIEVHNGRAVFQNLGPKALTWARLNKKPTAASSDAHGKRGAGTTYSVVPHPPTAQNLVAQLQTAKLVAEHPPLHSLLYPTYHRLRKMLGRT